MSAIQDYNSRWGRFNDWRCSGMLPMHFVFSSKKYFGCRTTDILLYRMPWGVLWKLTPKLQDSFLYVITSAGELNWLFSNSSTIIGIVFSVTLPLPFPPGLSKVKYSLMESYCLGAQWGRLWCNLQLDLFYALLGWIYPIKSDVREHLDMSKITGSMWSGITIDCN